MIGLSRFQGPGVMTKRQWLDTKMKRYITQFTISSVLRDRSSVNVSPTPSFFGYPRIKNTGDFQFFLSKHGWTSTGYWHEHETFLRTKRSGQDRIDGRRLVGMLFRQWHLLHPLPGGLDSLDSLDKERSSLQVAPCTYSSAYGLGLVHISL
ncbi:uncharacterized protein BCR38DRAFT_447989 [Pseudomassariella vexata]|uniref:Uncharacterized protein n=1 Tax=Pseudomassariella vexata TaxID=1141098 RepID=A0A1Y2DH67_9PEZI|nr:uncharacterized protein BCR38DRAFT_447989 [Pseudomassariella vexata]ORY58085.1 hypothetical protein BCR38DRAFT_447989 [Pseudomassariella vexata]